MVDLVVISESALAVVLSTSLEQVTPYKISFLIFLEEYFKNIKYPDFERDKLTGKDERAICLLLLDSIQSTDMDLTVFLTQIASMNKPKLVEDMLPRLQNIYEGGVHALMDTMNNSSNFFFVPEKNECCLGRNSVVGLYIRRLILDFEDLTFGEITHVYECFQEYWKAYTSRLAVKTIGDLEEDEDEEMQSEVPARDSFYAHPSHQRFSRKQAENFVHRQIKMIQCNEQVALPPRELHNKLSDLLVSEPHFGEAHYLMYLNYLRVRDYSAAIDALHQCFDKLCIFPPKSKAEEEPSNKAYAYGALNLAALLFKFGHRLEAISALQECLRLAQESGDPVCLQHVLGWLQRMQPASSSSPLLDCLISRTSDLNQTYLGTLAWLSKSHHQGLHKSADVSGQVKDSLLIPPELLPETPILIKGTERTLLYNEVMPTMFAEKASLALHKGHRHISLMYILQLMYTHHTDPSIPIGGDPLAIVLVNLAWILHEHGYIQESGKVVDYCQRLFPVPCPQDHIWKLTQERIKFRQCLLKDDLPGAATACRKIRTVNAEEADYCQSWLLLHEGEFHQCLDLIDTALAKYRVKNQQGGLIADMDIRLLLVKGELLSCTDNSGHAMVALLDCVQLCEQRGLTYMNALALLHIAHIQLELGLEGQSMDIIKAHLPTILAQGNLYDIARSLVLAAKCYRTRGMNSAPDRNTDLGHSHQLLQRSKKMFKTIFAFGRVKNVVYWQAAVCNDMNDTRGRNRYAMEFKQLDTSYPTFNYCLLNAF